MKKFLLVGMLLLSWNLLMAQDDVVRDGSTCENAILFDWDKGHIQDANQTLWYAVTLDDSFLNKELVLYLNNLTYNLVFFVRLKFTRQKNSHGDIDKERQGQNGFINVI